MVGFVRICILVGVSISIKRAMLMHRPFYLTMQSSSHCTDTVLSGAVLSGRVEC